MNNKELNVVVIGGGHGQSVILRGIKFIPNINISAIVTVADDGGSTGRLRRQYHIPAMGDIRAVLIALAESETLLKDLMEYRFEKPDEGEDEQDVAGHNLGNLILTALTQSCGSFMESVSILSKILNVRGDIIPATTQVITLFARMADGTIVRGESNIPDRNNRIDTVFYQEKVVASEKAVKAIEQADIIIYGIGSIFTSILPNLIIPEIGEAIRKTKARGIYLCNAMTQAGETDDFTLEDHVEALIRHGARIDEVWRASDRIPEEILQRYADADEQPVRMNCDTHDYQVITESLLDFSQNVVRHDADKIRNCLRKRLNEMGD